MATIYLSYQKMCIKSSAPDLAWQHLQGASGNSEKKFMR